MGSLIRKDLKLIKPWEYFFSLAMLIVLFIGVTPYSFVRGTLFLAIVFILMSSSREKSSSARTMVLALPVSRKEIVTGKYLSVLVWYIISVLLMLVIAIVRKLIPMGTDFPSVSEMVFVISILFIFFAISFPLQFVKQEVTNFLLIFLAAFFNVLSFTVDLLPSNRGIAIMALISGFLYFLSFKLSCSIIGKKDYKY